MLRQFEKLRNVDDFCFSHINQSHLVMDREEGGDRWKMVAEKRKKISSNIMNSEKSSKC